MTSVSRTARRSPIPTQLNGRTIVYGSWYCCQAPLAKYSEASFWKPYVEIGGGDKLRTLGRREHVHRLVRHRGAHNDDPLEMTARRAAMAASNVEARIRSFSASRS